MITFFILVLVIATISTWGYFVSNDLKMQSQQLDRQKIDLKNEIQDIESKKKKFAEDYDRQHSYIEFEKHDISQVFQKALSIRDETDKKIESSEIQMNHLKKHIRKLQTELDNARQKSKRLAKNARNTV
jgi:predicted  nucleic acid-binding Zn-ribbon protein